MSVREAAGKENAFSSGAKRTGSDDPASKNQDLVRQFAWAIASPSTCTSRSPLLWAKTWDQWSAVDDP